MQASVFSDRSHHLTNLSRSKWFEIVRRCKLKNRIWRRPEMRFFNTRGINSSDDKRYLPTSFLVHRANCLPKGNEVHIPMLPQSSAQPMGNVLDLIEFNDQLRYSALQNCPHVI